MSNMSPDETVRKIDGHMRAKHMLHEKIAAAARAVLPVLLDAGRVNSAKELQELLFEMDAKDQEMVDFIAADPVGTMGALMRSMLNKR